MGFERQPERQPIVGIVKVHAADVTNTLKAVQQRITVNMERFGSAGQVAEMFKEGLQRFQQFGALVTIGVMLASLSGAVYLGHRVGLDFAMADEADVRSSGPIVLLASAVLVAFPISGYLVARASAATSVLEPAMGAGLAIVAVIAALSITAPISVVFALAVAPIAFALACGGAWIGMEH